MNPLEDSSMYFKQKRDEYLIDIRKKKNTEHIQTKRIKFSLDGAHAQDGTDLPILPPLIELAASFMEIYKAGDLDALSNVLEFIRRSVSLDESPPISELLNTGIVPCIIDLLQPKFYQAEKIIVECSWIAANIVSREPEHTHFLVGLDISPRALDLLDHINPDVKDNAIWILANLSGESLVYRNDLLKRGIVEKIAAILDANTIKEEEMTSLSWLMVNLCRGKPYPDFEEVSPLRIYFKDFVENYENEEVLFNTFWALAHLADGDERQIQKVIKLEIIDEIIDWLGRGNYKIQVAVLRLIGNLMSGSDQQTQALVSRGVVEALCPFLFHQVRLIRKEVCWIYSNILGGTTDQVGEVFDFDDGKIIAKLFELIRKDQQDVAEECIFGLTNACDRGTPEDIGVMIDHDFIELLVEVLQKNEKPNILKACLNGIGGILDSGKEIAIGDSAEENPYFVRLLQADGLAAIERLHQFPDEEVTEMVDKLLDSPNL